jgi:hypothetical protein
MRRRRGGTLTTTASAADVVDQVRAPRAARTVLTRCLVGWGTPSDASWNASSAALSAQLAQPASVVRLHPFLHHSSSVVVSEDVDELEDHQAAIGGKRADR